MIDADWEEKEAARAARQAGGEKALDPGTAAVAAEPGVYHLVPGASAMLQSNDTDFHASFREQWRLAGKPLGELITSNGRNGLCAGGVGAEHEHDADRRFASPGGPASDRGGAYVCAEQRPPVFLA